MAKTKYLFDGPRVCKRQGHPDRTDYVRAWHEGKGRNAEIAVQVWKGKDKPDGEPDGDWAMPVILGADTSIAQAVAQT